LDAAVASAEPFDAPAEASEPDPLDESGSAAPLAVSLVGAALRRSFFAQPEPLKWMAGGANALRTGPEPHNGQLAGGSSSSPWIASNRRPHAEQS
jgi:hypothetical protein